MLHTGVCPSAVNQACKSICSSRPRAGIYVVEVKRQREIGSEIIAEMEVRVARVPHRPDTSVRTVLVYDGHLSPGVESEGYFDALVSLRELIGL